MTGRGSSAAGDTAQRSVTATGTRRRPLTRARCWPLRAQRRLERRRYWKPPKSPSAGAGAEAHAHEALTRALGSRGDRLRTKPNEDCHCRTGPSGLTRGARLAMESSVRQGQRRNLGLGHWVQNGCPRSANSPALASQPSWTDRAGGRPSGRGSPVTMAPTSSDGPATPL